MIYSFISSQPKVSIVSKKFFNKSCEEHQPKEGYEIESQNYAVIFSQRFISSKPKLSIVSKKCFNNSCKAHQPNEE